MVRFFCLWNRRKRPFILLKGETCVRTRGRSRASRTRTFPKTPCVREADALYKELRRLLMDTDVCMRGKGDTMKGKGI